MSETLYLDSRDLINVIRYSDPLTTAELRTILRDRHAKLVYSFSNVFEVVNFGNESEQRRRVRILDSFPKTFIAALPRLIELEFLQALLAFHGEMRRTPQLNAFRDQFHQTFAHGLPQVRESFEQLIMKMLREYPALGKNTEDKLKVYMSEVSIDRAHPAAKRKTWEWFKAGVANMFFKFGFENYPRDDFEAFCRWLNQHGEAVPGWRVFQGAQAAFTDNLGDEGERGDPPDYSHIISVCYVDSATLDNRMRGYYASSIRLLKKAYPDIKYFEHRVFRNLAEWV